MTQVSVIIATYKRPQTLARAIACALAQTVADIEVVVAIETDDTLSLEALVAQTDPRVRYVVNPIRGGPGIARDTAARAACSPWVAFLDDDDEWTPDKLEHQLAIADERTIVTTLSHVITPAGTFLMPGMPYDGTRRVDEWLFDRQSWLRGGDAMLQTSSLMMPRAVFDTLGFGRSRHEEWELVIRATLEHGYRLVTVPIPLVTYYAGFHFSWQASKEWAQSMQGIMSPRALSGFCLNAATQAIKGKGRTRGFMIYLLLAFRLGQPTPKQLFAFWMMWAIPSELRQQLRVAWRRVTMGMKMKTRGQ